MSEQKQNRVVKEKE